MKEPPAINDGSGTLGLCRCGGFVLLPIADKLGIGFCHHNHGRKEPFAGFIGMLNFARKIPAERRQSNQAMRATESEPNNNSERHQASSNTRKQHLQISEALIQGSNF